MGRQAKIKKQRKAANKRGIPVVAPTVLVTSMFGEEPDDDGLLHDCPVCAAMREMGLQDGDEMTPEQYERFVAAAREAEQHEGAIVWQRPRDAGQ